MLVERYGDTILATHDGAGKVEISGDMLINPYDQSREERMNEDGKNYCYDRSVTL